MRFSLSKLILKSTEQETEQSIKSGISLFERSHEGNKQTIHHGKFTYEKHLIAPTNYRQIETYLLFASKIFVSIISLLLIYHTIYNNQI